MKLEKLKSILLMTLIVSSLFLSFQLFVIKAEIKVDYKEISQTSSKSYKPVENLISPERIVINYSEENHTIFYSDFGMDFWENSRTVFNNSFFDDEILIKTLEKQEYLDKLSQKSIIYRFGTKIPTRILFEINEAEIPESLSNQISEVKEIYIELSKNPQIIFKNDESIIEVSLNKFDTEYLISSVDEVKDIDYIKYRTGKIISAPSDVLLPINLDETQTNMYVSNDIDVNDIEHIETIVENFFGEVETARKIEENDGSLIYMYDRRGLVFTSKGVLKYFDEIKSPITTRDLYKSLVTYSMFLDNYDYSPQDVYLAKIEEIQNGENQGYRFSFNYRIDQKSVILNGNFSSELDLPIEVDVYNDYVKSYKRYYRKAASLDSLETFSFSIDYIMSPIDIINQNLELIKSNYRSEDESLKENTIEIDNRIILSSISDVTASYYDYCDNDGDSKLIDAWVIQIGAYRYIFDAYSGEIINYAK